jgi:hypothetical protein
LAKAGQVDKRWPTPISVPNASFDFESALELSIEKEELFGYLDCGDIGCGLFSGSPLTSPEPTPPPSPFQQPTSLDSPLSPPEPLPMPGDSSSTAAGLPGEAKKADGRYRSNKTRSHAKRKRERANERKEREAGGQPYDARASTRLKHVHQSDPVEADVNLADIPISDPGYIGLRDAKELKDRTKYALDDLVGAGSHFKFKLLKWDGR